MGKFKSFISFCLHISLYMLAKVVKKDRNIWIFGAWFGKQYSDNSRYLFEYVNKHHSEIDAIWLSDADFVVERLRSQGFRAYRRKSFWAIWYALRAGCSIFVHSNSADCLAFMNNKKTKLIQLWHGAPIKKIGFDDKFANISKQKSFKDLLRPYVDEHYDLFTALGEMDAKVYKSAFLPSHIVKTGFARNDVLIQAVKEKKDTIVYLPTFRGAIGDEVELFESFGFDPISWDAMLENLGMRLLIKTHPVNKPTSSFLKSIETCKYISFVEEESAELLAKADMLITDYSSVFIDFLLTGRAIVFAPFDFESYVRNDREFYYDYEAITPGPKCRDWDEVLVWVRKFHNNPALFAPQREKILEKFHTYTDANGCKRIFEEIVGVLDG